MQAVEWGEYELQKLFTKIKIPALRYKTGDLPSVPCGEYVLPALTAGIQNQGLNNYVPREKATVLKMLYLFLQTAQIQEQLSIKAKSLLFCKMLMR